MDPLATVAVGDDAVGVRPDDPGVHPASLGRRSVSDGPGRGPDSERVDGGYGKGSLDYDPLLWSDGFSDEFFPFFDSLLFVLFGGLCG